MPIIQVDNVSMRFNLAQEKTETLKEYTVKLLKHQLFFNEFYALQDVSFSIEPGESVALIGRNGSGKSTMLKLIAGVMYPSKGSVRVNGEIAPLIELGAGFDMELTAPSLGMTVPIWTSTSRTSSTLPNCGILSMCR